MLVQKRYMEKRDHLNEDMIKEYSGILYDLLTKYIDHKIDIRTLEIEYRNSTNDVAKKHGIATPFPFTPEYTKLDDYGKKIIEKSIGMKFPRSAIESILEECGFTEPGLKFDDTTISLLEKIDFKEKKDNEKKKHSN